MQHTSISARPFRDDSDFQRIAVLQNACEAVDQLDWGITAEELRVELTSMQIDLARDLRIWQDQLGATVGYGEIELTPAEDHLTGTCFILVSPALRGQGLEQAMLGWAQARIRQAAGEQHLAPCLKTYVRSDDRWRRPLFEALGTPACFMWRMQRDLQQPLPAPVTPQGYHIRALRGAEDLPGWTAAYNASFVDAWDFHPKTVEEASRFLRADPWHRPELDLVAETAGGELAGFCLATINPAENERSGRLAGGIRLLGIRRGHRGRGLGRALLLEGLGRLQRAGMQFAWLGVDSSSPTGATRLYEAVGFSVLHTFLTWVVEL